MYLFSATFWNFLECLKISTGLAKKISCRNNLMEFFHENFIENLLVVNFRNFNVWIFGREIDGKYSKIFQKVKNNLIFSAWAF